MRERVALAVSLAAVVVMCAFIFAMSERPSDESDALSLGVVDSFVAFAVPGFHQMTAAEQERWRGGANHLVRKAAHFLEYAALGALALNFLWQLRRVRPAMSSVGGGGARRRSSVDARLVAGAWLFATAYAASDELHQLFVAGRNGMLSDVALDSAGALLAALVLAAVLNSARDNRD